MALTYSIALNPGTTIPPFKLKKTDLNWIDSNTFGTEKGILILFICNHCPYVKAVFERIEALCREFKEQGIRVIGINSNDTTRYPEDSFENMQKLVLQKRWTFEYAIDPGAKLAQLLKAQCTPDPYLFKKSLTGYELFYQGRIDDSPQNPDQVTSQELRNAIVDLLHNRPLSFEPKPSMGCSIKWPPL